ncbi:defensin-5-like [Sciurus carolinensis]|uniref:defensin-5-like n=1 Tax=Sciurus carolinensis TaxID=30640 RepID=UPI001FB49C7A|nr:defensin-5-like [Sciurus carolinensis]
MRTLALLTTLLLLALQAQAQPLSERNEEAPDQEQSGEKNQDVEISFAGAAASALREAGPRDILRCRCALFGCSLSERNSGSCFQGGRVYTFCCRRVK